jgi:hypothetical protein
MVAMTGVFDRQKAVLEFRRFVARHGASQGRHAGFVASNPPPVQPAEISRFDALDVFFKLHPEHADHRTEVSTDFVRPDLLSFSKERWEETTSKLSAAKPN